MLATGELWPSARVLAEEENKEAPGETAMEGVEHIGQYVWEMTQTKIKQLQDGGGASLPPVEEEMEEAEEEIAEDGEDGDEEDDEEDDADK
jgi:intron-binding protein aquarius